MICVDFNLEIRCDCDFRHTVNETSEETKTIHLVKLPRVTLILLYISMGESNTVVSAYTLYRHLQQYCSHKSI